MKRLPNKNQILSVYAVGVTILYTWAAIITIRDSLFNWILYFNTIELLVLTAYIMAGTFLESLFLIATLLLICVVLPQTWFADRFVVRGTVLVIAFLSSIMYYYTQTPLGEALVNLYKWILFFLFITIVLILMVEYIKPAGMVAELVAERSMLFLYIYLPISFISLIVIIIRNIG